ncbi:DUF4136 domain-containing protein [Ideonella sp. 4Y16]|uniref:DUF4136 domain-containing protein n=1 Tax=Ideonella alba TaxID=2824118 RepID=A0A940Y986_9BURK|nr:DUF4136 domain-containing protein [Ideonella alba]MBQ0930008.1 DUF4136 domain-containing protein [Ideonella alba]MBQ0946068.1 DUF4136 domain-containing protein [Ideonella alba]
MPNAIPNTLRRHLLIAVLGAAALSGCASLNTFSGEVSSFGDWPAGRAPGSFAFERLPSQQQDPEEQGRLERLATVALQAKGFQPAAPGAKPDVVVQVGARISRQTRSPWDDPLWWRFGPGVRWYGPWSGWSSWRWSNALDPEYGREVALLLRDGPSGTPLYEARASNAGATPGNDKLLEALFLLSMNDFPAARGEPHSASVVRP